MSTDPSLLQDYCDGTDFKSHPLFTIHRTGLQIQLYYDDVELCNPLGSSRTKHKVGELDKYFIQSELLSYMRFNLLLCALIFTCTCRAVLLQSWEFAPEVPIKAKKHTISSDL